MTDAQARKCLDGGERCDSHSDQMCGRMPQRIPYLTFLL
jgi:hypothetical protein